MPTDPAPTPTSASLKGAGLQKDTDPQTKWVDNEGHQIEPAGGGEVAWIHADGPITRCAAVEFLRFPPEDVRALPGLDSGFYKRRRYQLAFEGVDNQEARA